MQLKSGLTLLAVALVVSTAPAQAPIDSHNDLLGDPLPDGAIARLGTTRLKHTPISNPLIQAAAYSPDGKFIVSRVGSEGPMRLWDAASGKELPGPWSAVDQQYTGMVFSPDSKILVAAISPGPSPALSQPQLSVEIVLWDIAEKKPIRSILGHPNFVRSMAFTDGGKTLVSAGNGAVCWWDVQTGKQNRLWKPFNDEQRAGKNKVPDIKFFINPCLSPDGRFLAVEAAWRSRDSAGSMREPSKEVFGFEVETGKIRWRTATTTDATLRLAFSGDSKRVAIAIGPDHVEVRDAITGKLVGGPVNGEFLRNSAVGGFALSNDGATLATAGKASHLSLWNVENPDPKKLRRLPGRLAQNRVNATEVIAFSPDGKAVLVGVDFDMQLYDFATLKEIQPWEGHRGWVTHVAFSADGKQLHTGAATTNPLPKEMISWDVATWKRLQLTSSQPPQRYPNIGIFSPDQRYFMGKTGEDRFVIYDMATAKQLGKLEVPANQDINARGFFSPSGNLFVLKNLEEAKAATKVKKNEVDRIYAVPSGKLLCELPASSVQAAVVATRNISFSADERLVALVSRQDNMVHVFETATGKDCQKLGSNKDQPPGPGASAYSANLAFSPDGKLLAGMSIQGNVVHVWDVQSGKERLQVPVDKQSLLFAWSADSRVLALVQDRNVRLCELASLGVRRELQGHDGPVRSIAFSPDGKFLASGGLDTTVLIWNIAAPRVAAKALDRESLEKCWKSLAVVDAAKAYSAMVELAASPEEALAWIKDKVKPAVAVPAKRIEDLIGQLDDNQFKVRQNAFGDLIQIGEQIVPAINNALAANPPLEARLRLEDLRTRMTGMALQGERLQAYRAVEMLEWIASPRSRQLLETLAGGAPGALVTNCAEESLARMTAQVKH